jgi:hypothetical protein
MRVGDMAGRGGSRKGESSKRGRGDLLFGVSDDFEKGFFEVGFLMSLYEFLRCAFFDDSTMSHDEDLLAHAVDFEHVMAGQKDGSISALLVLEEVIPDPGRCVWIEAGCWFIQKQELRFVNEGFGKGNSGFLACGELAKLFVQKVFEFEVFCQLLNPVLCVFYFVKSGVDIQVLSYCQTLR